MGKPEADVESFLDEMVASYRGFTRKWTSPGHNSVQDRICFLPDGEIWFIEVKIKGAIPEDAQFREIFRQRRLGHNSGFLAGKYEVTRFLTSINRKQWMDRQMSRYADSF